MSGSIVSIIIVTVIFITLVVNYIVSKYGGDTNHNAHLSALFGWIILWTIIYFYILISNILELIFICSCSAVINRNKIFFIKWTAYFLTFGFGIIGIMLINKQNILKNNS